MFGRHLEIQLKLENGVRKCQFGHSVAGTLFNEIVPPAPCHSHFVQGGNIFVHLFLVQM